MVCQHCGAIVSITKAEQHHRIHVVQNFALYVVVPVLWAILMIAHYKVSSCVARLLHPH
jgi:hypothetical protein